MEKNLTIIIALVVMLCSCSLIGSAVAGVLYNTPSSPSGKTSTTKSSSRASTSLVTPPEKPNTDASQTATDAEAPAPFTEQLDKGVKGRYIQISNSNVGCMNLAGIQVYSSDDGLNLIGSDTVVTTSSGYQGDKFPAKNFTDGNPATFVHTSCTDAPWVLVDLLKEHLITKVVILNRGDCCAERAKGTIITIATSDKKVVYTSDGLNSTSSSYTIRPPAKQVTTFLPITLALKGGRAKKYCADESDKVICNRDNRGEWETFKIEDLGNNQIALLGGRSSKYCSDQNDKIVCNRDKRREWETFKIEVLGDNQIALRGGRENKYCADEEGKMICNRNARTALETFAFEEPQKLEFQPDNQVIQSRRRNDFCLDVPEGSKENGRQIAMWNCHEDENQQFQMDDKQRLVIKHSGKCLDVAGAKTSAGANVIQWDCHDGDNQKWEYDAQGRLHPKHAKDKCLDIAGNSDQNGAKVFIWDCHGGDNQKWFV